MEISSGKHDQYAGRSLKWVVLFAGILTSRRGNCHDNAVAERFFQLLKRERIKKKIYGMREEARSDIFDYIEVFYNRVRRHSHLGGVSPEAFEQASS